MVEAEGGIRKGPGLEKASSCSIRALRAAPRPPASLTMGIVGLRPTRELEIGVSVSEEQLRVGREKVVQVFRFLEALNQHRNEAKRHLDDQLWRLWFCDLPDHSCIEISPKIDSHPPPSGIADLGQNPTRNSDFILKVKRPKLTSCPEPPEVLRPWLERGWNEPTGEPDVRKAILGKDDHGATISIPFEADLARPQALRQWLGVREVWLKNEKPARAAMHVFEKLYEIRGQIEREGEKIELILGDGILSWKRDDGGIFHPVLLQRLQLEFDPKVPEFSIIEAGSSVEFYSALFQSMPDVDGKLLARMREELDAGKYHPLGKEDTSGLLRSLVTQLSAQGQFQSDAAPKGFTNYPVIGRSPVIFLRPRNLGFAIAIQSALASLAQDCPIPSSLMRIVGAAEDAVSVTADQSSSWVDQYQPSDILLSKPANPQQIQIATILEKQGSVLVQGPPGTGKTHTIANLIGHLLAQGKTILVTSHATKALKVVREQVVPELRPLCVSLLDSDVDSRQQLENSVNSIVGRLSLNNVTQLEKQAVDLAGQRTELLSRYKSLADSILKARGEEYRDIVVGGFPLTPSDAARRVYEGVDRCDYLPGQVELGSPFPLSDLEVAELYRTNGLVSSNDEDELKVPLPDICQLPTAAVFRSLTDERKELAGQDLTYRTDLWTESPKQEDLSQLDSVSDLALKVAKSLNTADRWQLTIMLAGYHGPEMRKRWENLLVLIEEVWKYAANVGDCIIQHRPELADCLPIEHCLSISQELLSHTERNGDVTFLALLTRGKWKSFIRNSRVSAGEPKSSQHFRALNSLAELTLLRRELTARWDSQMVPLGLPELDAIATHPETVCRQYAPHIQRCLDWNDTELNSLEVVLSESGLCFRRLLDEQPPNLESCGELLRLSDLLSGPIQGLLAARRNLIAWNRIEAQREQFDDHLTSFTENGRSTTLIEKLRCATRDCNTVAYAEAITRLNELWNCRKHLETRRLLLSKLEIPAPGWAAAVRNRVGIHGQTVCPENIQDAWLWRQIANELDRRNNVSLRQLEEDAIRTTDSLRMVTSELIERKAWSAELKRTENNLSQQQALIGWLDTVKKMGKETGIRVPRLKADASRLMTTCRGAVPVWIMPMSRVVETFDPQAKRFDVVIVDEASQSDVMGLLALYYADTAIVVGDNEQVSPSAIGQKLEIVQHLIDEHLRSVPNGHLYDGQTSIYDLARASFGATIRLIEHFRCVPEIIQFSNQLCYDGAIRPLRDSSLVSLKPHVIPYRVKDAVSNNKTNAEEAQELAALVLSACEQPEYAGKTFGVVSLVGDDQAYLIDTLLRKHLSEEQFKTQHDILCGNAAHFQGDERDVMFLSMVDTSDGGVLRMRQESMFKQRFNVAASRAKDQMWVVHSLDHKAHLKPGDLRRRLIEHAENPYAVLNELNSVESKTESPFEKEVASRLIQAGYRVVPQWRVGYYRIDLVVESNGKKVAIECDGDRYHPIEKLPEDMARQAVLERLGWKFIRIRGTAFFRDPDTQMKIVIAQMFSLGIEPSGPEPTVPASSAQQNAVVKRVILRANEIRREWRGLTSETTLGANPKGSKQYFVPPLGPEVRKAIPIN